MIVYLYQLPLIVKSEMFNNFKIKYIWEMILLSKVRQKKLVFRNVHIFVLMSGFHDPLVPTHFNTFLDEC